MKLLKFKEKLNEKGIYLFDADLRITHHRFNELVEEMKLIKVGGGFKKERSKSLSKDFISKLTKNQTEKLLFALKEYNYKAVGWIVKSYFE